MKLYLIVYVAGKVIGFTGPYSMDECHRRAAETQSSCVDGAYRCSDIRYSCDWTRGRPTIDPAFIN